MVKAILVAGITGFAVLALMTELGHGAQPKNKNVIQRELVLVVDPDLGCVVKLQPENIPRDNTEVVRRNVRINWHVVNECPEEKTVTVGDFAHLPWGLRNGTKKDILSVQLKGNPRVTPIPSGGQGDIEYLVKPSNQAKDDGWYKYTIFVCDVVEGAVAVDAGNGLLNMSNR